MSYSSYVAAVLADGPLVYYPLDDASGTIVDASGNGYDGTPTGGMTYQSRPSPIEGDSLDYLELNGSTGRIKIDGTDPPFAGAQEGYIECWVQPDSDGAGAPLILFHAHDPTNSFTEFRMGLGTFDKDIACKITAASDLINPISATELLVAGEWHMIGLNVKEDDNTGLYIDGQLYPGGSDTLGYWWADIAVSTMEFVIGAAWYAGGFLQFFDGAIAHFSMYDHHLSAERIHERYCQARPSECAPPWIIGRTVSGVGGLGWQ